MILQTLVVADWKDDVGFIRLQNTVGGDLPTSLTDGFTQVEAPDGSSNYMPNTGLAIFSGKTFTNKTNTSSAVSSHANSVATNYYSTSSLLPGTAATAVDVYEANHWIGSGFLRTATLDEPATELRATQNHSWIGSTGTPATDAEINQRLDFAIHRDGFVCVVGMNNGSGAAIPGLLAQSYNTISVGLTNGNHSHGTTTNDGIGRIKPEIVAPHDNFTSYATPMVASAAGLLYEKLSASPHSQSGADLPRSIKAILLTSARKDSVANWDNTTTRPLDDVYGAGELNIYNAFMVMNAGEKASGSTQHGGLGWSTETVNANSSKTYFFTIPSGSEPTPFCVGLTWHRIVTDSIIGANWGSLLTTLTDLNLKLHNASGTTIGSEITNSSSTVDNVEMIYQSALPAGDYAIVIENTSLSDNTDFAVAWHSRPTVTIATSASEALEVDGTNGEYTFTRNGDTTYPLIIPITPSGDAVADTHYTALPANITIPASQTSATLSVDPISDNIAQGDRTVTVTASDDFALVSSDSADVTIKDKPADVWKFSVFTTAELADSDISGDAADPDVDGIPNLMEYALNLNPKSSNPTPAEPQETSGYLSLSVSKNPDATDLTWSAEASSDFATWDTATILTNDQNSFEARDTVLKSESDRRLMRIRVSR